MRVTVIAAVLVLLPLPPALAAAAPSAAVASPLELTLEVVPEQPQRGDRVYWLARLRNASARTLQIPTRTQEWMFFGAHHQPLDSMGGYGHAVGVSTKVPPLEWRALAPGAAIEAAGEVADEVAQCRRGCPLGDYSLWVDLAVPPQHAAIELPPDHVLPSGLRAVETFSIIVPPIPQLERSAAGSVEVEALSARTVKGAIHVRVRLRNRTQTPLWLPKPASLATHCSIRVEEENGAIGMNGGGGMGGPDEWSEQDAVLVPPGRAVEGEALCEDGPLPRRGTLTIHVVPPGVFQPRRSLQPPFVWAGSAESAPLRIGTFSGSLPSSRGR